MDIKKNPFTSLLKRKKWMTAAAVLWAGATLMANAAKIHFEDGVPSTGENYLVRFVNVVHDANTIFLADDSTTPTNPFSDVSRSLYLKNDDGSSVPSMTWQFTEPDAAADRGSVSIQFNLIEDGFNVSLGSFDGRNNKVSTLLRLLANQRAVVGGPDGNVTTGLYTAAGENLTLTIKWEPEGFYLLLNGVYDSDSENNPILYKYRNPMKTDSIVVTGRSGETRKAEYLLGAIEFIPGS